MRRADLLVGEDGAGHLPRGRHTSISARGKLLYCVDSNVCGPPMQVLVGIFGVYFGLLLIPLRKLAGAASDGGRTLFVFSGLLIPLRKLAGAASDGGRTLFVFSGLLIPLRKLAGAASDGGRTLGLR